ncbi:SH3 domain-containing C40 family peptidase [Desulfurispira natronophila]|uniref:Glycoside hydrolase n=1 Tax=Desulfurispira natronophila TaxID=682562 RepID=A0A7W7Y2U1_9BACT|nr:SH3 domain-containing C40 family peptidase [Desulfurispira natronophila]MBB5021043.1 hypothetical protein [Desulfurispira natronophila]
MSRREYHTFFAFIFVFLGFISGCAHSAPYPYDDIAAIPQELEPFVQNSRFMSESEQLFWENHYREQRLIAWEDNYQYDINRIVWPWTTYTPDRGFGANKKPLSQSWFSRLAQSADLANYPSDKRKAITLRLVHLRNFPTHEPFFRSFDRPGQGFPFDLLQNSTLHPMTPVRISHQSAGGDWLFIESDHAHGWVKPHDVAILSESQAEVLAKAPLLAVVAERTPVRSKHGSYLFTADIGTLLPVKFDASGKKTLLVVDRESQGRARLVKGKVNTHAMSLWPLPAIDSSLSALAQQTIGQTYGWGGLYGGRDCSALVRDLLTPFGRHLPRNSRQQSLAGQLENVSNLQAHQKEQALIERGRPFATLVNFPGHVGLYLGTYDDHAVILHSAWGHRTRNWRGVEGRSVMGQTVVTTLRAGSGLAGHGSAGLVDRMTSYTWIDSQVEVDPELRLR